ncbi:MAG: ABC transporter ATP-binding protein [Candidatus Latescibacteria bacterium]|nr:ABC transporter ATP-binding protein [Candidatus Latescibacterota bacterium]
MNEVESELPALEARGLAKTYVGGASPVEVLRGADIRVPRGELVAVVGASGSGKSTLLHLLGGLDRPTAGSITVGGADLGALDEAGRSKLRSRSVGFVFQFHQLLPEFTALENVMMPGWIAGAPRAATRERALGLLGDLGLRGRADHKPSELSGGEQQRVAVARALHMKPSILLADEPTGNLDRRAASTLLEIFERYRSLERQAIVVATHNPDVAKSAGRVLALEDGCLKPIRI